MSPLQESAALGLIAIAIMAIALHVVFRFEHKEFRWVMAIAAIVAIGICLYRMVLLALA